MAVVISCFRFVFAAVTSDQALSHLDRISQLTLQIGLSHDQKSQPEHVKWPGNKKNISFWVMWHKAQTFDSSKLVLHNVGNDSSGRKQVRASIFWFAIIKLTLKSWGDKFRNFKKDKTIFSLEINLITYSQLESRKKTESPGFQVAGQNLRTVSN